MDRVEDATYLFRRARQEAEKAEQALARGADGAVVSAHRELALRYRVRALSRSAGSVPCIDATGTSPRAGGAR